MKKLMTTLLLVVALLSISVPVFGATNKGDDFKYLSEEIITTVNDLMADKLSRQITISDIDFNNVFKIYVGVNVFKMDTENVNDLVSAFGTDQYIYELPIYVDGDTIIVNIAKGQAIDNSVDFTEEERQNVIENAGKWGVTSVKLYEDEIVNYESEVQNKIGKIPDNMILVGGLPHFRYAVALLYDENDTVTELVPLSDIPGIENISNLRSESNNSYEFSAVKEYINQLPEPNPDQAGAYGFIDSATAKTNYIVWFTAGTAIICLIAAIYIFKYKKRV